MPAPVPVNFAADLGPLAELALRAGAAQGQRRDFEQRRALDLSVLRDELNRRQRQSEIETQFRSEQAARLQREAAGSGQQFALRRAAQRGRHEQRNIQAGTHRLGISQRTAPLRRAVAATTQAEEPMVDLNAEPGRGAITTSRGTFDLQPDGSVARRSPGFGQDLVDPLTGELNLSRLPDRFRDPEAVVRDRAIGGAAGFVNAGRGRPDEVTMDVAQQLQVLEAAKSIPPSDRNLLEQAIRSGGLTTNQLLNSIEERTPKPNDPRKLDGLSVRDRELEMQRLRRRRLSFNEFNDPDHSVRDQIDQAMDAEREKITRQQAIQDAPQISGTSLASPAPTAQGRTLSEGMAVRFFEQAGGDPEQARRLARDAGFNIPQR